MKVYVVSIHAVKASKTSYILGVFKTYESAQRTAVEHTDKEKENSSWWTQFVIREYNLND